jgi:hypothetical protein
MIWDKQQIQFPNKEWIMLLWRYLDITDVVIPEFGNWCLFPSVWYDREHTLVSSSLAYTVVDIESFQTGLAEDISMRMKCSFEPGNNVQNEDRIRFVVADKVTRAFPLVATNGASIKSMS